MVVTRTWVPLAQDPCQSTCSARTYDALTPFDLSVLWAEFGWWAGRGSSQKEKKAVRGNMHGDLGDVGIVDDAKLNRKAMYFSASFLPTPRSRLLNTKTIWFSHSRSFFVCNPSKLANTPKDPENLHQHRSILGRTNFKWFLEVGDCWRGLLPCSVLQIRPLECQQHHLWKHELMIIAPKSTSWQLRTVCIPFKLLSVDGFPYYARLDMLLNLG